MTPTGSEARPKTEKELKKEAAKAEKLKKFAEKQAKLQQQKLQQGQKAKDEVDVVVLPSFTLTNCSGEGQSEGQAELEERDRYVRRRTGAGREKRC